MRKEAAGIGQPVLLPPPSFEGAEHCTFVSLVATTLGRVSAPGRAPRHRSLHPPSLPARRKGTPFLPQKEHFSCLQQGSPHASEPPMPPPTYPVILTEWVPCLWCFGPFPSATGVCR